MQDFSALPDDELFRINCEVKEAVENRLQKFDSETFLKMCEQEILFAAQQKRNQVSVSLVSKDAAFNLRQFFERPLSEGFSLWLKRFLETTEIAAFAPHAYVWEETSDVINLVFHW